MTTCKNCHKDYTIQKTCACSKGEAMQGFCLSCIELLDLDIHDENDWRVRFEKSWLMSKTGEGFCDNNSFEKDKDAIKSFIIKILKERDAYWMELMNKMMEKDAPPAETDDWKKAFDKKLERDNRVTWGELKLFITAEKLKSFGEGEFHSNNLIHDIVADKLTEAIEVFRRVMQDNPLTPPEQAEAFEREAKKLTSKP